MVLAISCEIFPGVDRSDSKIFFLQIYGALIFFTSVKDGIRPYYPMYRSTCLKNYGKIGLDSHTDQNFIGHSAFGKVSLYCHSNRNSSVHKRKTIQFLLLRSSVIHSALLAL